MNPFQVLKRQITKLLTTEAGLSASERAMFDWRFVVTQEGKTHIFGKTGANTMYYIDGNQTPHEPQAMYPDQLLEFLDTLSKSKFIHFGLYKKNGKKLKVAKRDIPDVDTAKKYRSSNTLIIFGVTPQGKRVKLFRTKPSLTGTVWVELKNGA